MKSKIIISLIFSLIIVFSGTNVFAYSENFDSYSDGYYLKDILNWSISTYEKSPLISNNYSVSNPLSLRLLPSSEGKYHYYYFDNPINEDFIFSFDFLTTYVNKDGFSLFFRDNDPTSAFISHIRFTSPAHPAEVYISNSSGGNLSVYSNMQTNTWYHIDIEFSFSTHSIRVNVNNIGWSDWVGFSIIRNQIDSLALYYENKPYGNITNFYLDNLSLPVEIDGTCGSANGGSFANTPNSNLCSSGDLGSMGVTDDGTTYRWSCMGSPGSGYENCSANVSLASAQCGYSNGTVALTEPYSSHACLNGSITDMTQNDSGSWSWKCRIDSTDFVFCNTVASAPVIPETLPSNDSISCSISPTDLSTVGDCIGSIFRWAFLPHQDTLNSFYSIPQTLSSKIPFGYFYSISDELKSMSFTTPANVVFSMKSFDSSDVVLLDVNSFKSWAGPDIVNFYFGVLRALLWFGFLIWIFNKGRNIFSSNDNEK